MVGRLAVRNQHRHLELMESLVRRVRGLLRVHEFGKRDPLSASASEVHMWDCAFNQDSQDCSGQLYILDSPVLGDKQSVYETYD